MSASVSNPSSTSDSPSSAASLPRVRFDFIPLLLIPALALLTLPLVGSSSSWITLTVAGLAMGMIIFITASGLTLVFGLMDVINFGHGVFISLGAFVGLAVLAPLSGWTTSTSLWANAAAIAVALLAAAVAAGVLGFAFERIIVRPVYGSHLKQMLVTMGGLIIVEELIKVVWGPQSNSLDMPAALRGAFILGEAAVERYRVLAVVVGALMFALMLWTLNRTKIGLLIRAGVQDREMVESLGYHIRRLFIGVFVAGSALAGIGGVMWGLYRQNVYPQIGSELTILIFIVIIIGGLGSTLGCFVGALLVGLITNYAGYLVPQVAPFSNVLLMIVILMWRPRGVYPVTNR